jgi:hypothetical protein
MKFILSNFVSAIIYGAIFTNRINAIPGFELSVGSQTFTILLSFIIGSICTLPIWLFFNFIIKSKKYNFWNFNVYFFLIIVPIIFLFQILFWKNFSDTLDILCSFGLVIFISLNIIRLKKCGDFSAADY